MPPVGFEPKISADEWPQTYALDRAATDTGKLMTHNLFYPLVKWRLLYPVFNEI